MFQFALFSYFLFFFFSFLGKWQRLKNVKRTVTVAAYKPSDSDSAIWAHPLGHCVQAGRVRSSLCPGVNYSRVPLSEQIFFFPLPRFFLSLLKRECGPDCVHGNGAMWLRSSSSRGGCSSPRQEEPKTGGLSSRIRLADILSLFSLRGILLSSDNKTLMLRPGLSSHRQKKKMRKAKKRRMLFCDLPDKTAPGFIPSQPDSGCLFFLI